MYLICSVSFFISAFAFYKLHNLWHKDVTENNKLYKFEIKAKRFKHWAAIGMLFVMGVVYFFKALP